VTGAYDGTVKAWDVRASAPLHTCVAHEDAKVLCVGLADKQSFSSGGSDNKLKSFVIS
jgi:WD40 repeat protein